MLRIIPALGIFAFLFNNIGCSSQDRINGEKAPGFGSKDYAEVLVSRIPARWFSGEERFSLLDREGKPMPHMFFDPKPSVDSKRRLLNFVATTPEGYPTKQTLDLASGQLYFSSKYCEQGDAWKKFKGSVYLPPYTEGVVPRALDQINMPQKIIVFGQKDYYQKYFKTNIFDARVVGGFVEQICPERGCVEKGSWLSRLVLVGVQRKNPKFKDVKNIEQLKKLVDWPQVKAFAGNGGGKNNVGGKLYPAYRMGAVVGPGQAISFLERNSHFFSLKEIASMRSSCRKLYDHIYSELFSGKGKTFFRNFREIFVKHQDQYNTCAKYVYPSSVNHDPGRHWFFAYLTGYYGLADLGYYYSCQRKSWISNPIMGSGKRLVGKREVFKFCRAEDVDDAMAQMPRFYEVLRNRSRASYRYIDYDGGTLGTHNKIYSWVPRDNKVLECSADEDGKFLENKLSVFPSDIQWEERAVKGKKDGYVR